MRSVELRNELVGKDRRHLSAYVDERGLHIDGQDLGPGTGMVSDDGEYEWSRTFATGDVPQVVALLDGQPGEDVLDVLTRWVGKTYELEKRIRESDIPSDMWTWSG